MKSISRTVKLAPSDKAERTFCFVDPFNTSAKASKSDLVGLTFSVQSLIQVSRLAAQGSQDGAYDLAKTDIIAIEEVLNVAQQLCSDLWSHIDESDFK